MCSLANPTHARLKNPLLNSQEIAETCPSPGDVEGSSDAENHGVSQGRKCLVLLSLLPI